MNDKLYRQYCSLIDKTIIPTNLPRDKMLERKQPLVDFIIKNTPKKLYKFRVCNERNIEAFRNQQIWFATGSQMNDDFDARLYCDKAWLANAWKAQIDENGELKAIKEFKKNREIPPHIVKLLDSNTLSIIYDNAATIDWDKLNSETITFVEKIIGLQLPFIDQAEQKSMKVSSFSEDISSPLMWGALC